MSRKKGAFIEFSHTKYFAEKLIGNPPGLAVIFYLISILALH